MATLITPLPNALTTITPVLTGVTGTASINSGEFFFYSNNPEKVSNSNLADQGKFLNQATVSGSGQVYVWHQNTSGQAVNACLLIYNPNSYAVKVTSTNYGLTKNSGVVPDTPAWESYCNGQSTSVTVNANSYGNIFLQNSIINNGVWGIVARLRIERSGTTTAASVTLTDFAYVSNSGNANSWATADGSTRRRGLANGFYTNLSFTLAPSNTNGIGVRLGKISDSSFNGSAEMANITDPSGSCSGRLEGCYGQQLNVTATIRNATATARKFRIFLGSIGGNSVPFCYFGNITKATTGRGANTYTEIIETANIAVNATEVITFTTVVPATAAAPYVIGAKTL
jgi:hypothetical protein